MPSERKFKGVNFVSRLSRYRAVIYANNKQIHVGYFTGSVAAAKAYDKAAIALGRSVSSLNFPPAE
jgi:hypothetical protein